MKASAPTPAYQLADTRALDVGNPQLSHAGDRLRDERRQPGAVADV
jgi:hypothetical protein